jgi:hypothetical protein
MCQICQEPLAIGKSESAAIWKCILWQAGKISALENVFSTVHDGTVNEL